MSVYIKLQEARAKLSGMDLKKSGENKFSKYKYYELGDFLPAITKICNEVKLCSFINFTDEVATLTVVDSENEQQIQFTSTVAAADLKGCHAIQNLGAVQTYLRRYLYMNAFEIVESDIIDETNDNSTTKKQKILSDAQIKRLYAIGNNVGVDKKDIVAVIVKEFNKSSVAELTKIEYEKICERLEKKANE